MALIRLLVSRLGRVWGVGEEQMEIQELKALIKESVREVLREERLLLCQVLMPYVSDEEQAEIEAEFGSPSDYDDEELEVEIDTIDVRADVYK